MATLQPERKGEKRWKNDIRNQISSWGLFLPKRDRKKEMILLKLKS